MQLNKKIRKIKIRWNDDKEEKFLADKKKALTNFYKIAKNPTYDDCGFARYTQKVLNDTDVKRLRVSLLDKVGDGQNLTEQELKYLELTSETLNRFLDKEEYQNATLMLDPDFLDYVVSFDHQLEVTVAEEILENYFLLRDKLKAARTKYMKQNIIEQKKSIEASRRSVERAENEEGKSRRSASNNNHMAYRRQMERVIKGEKTLKELQKSIGPGSLSKDFVERNFTGFQTCKKAGYRDMSQKEYKHMNHPPSKLIQDPYKNTDPTYMLSKFIQDRGTYEQSYRLFTRDKSKLANKNSFIGFYYNGPLSRQSNRMVV